MIKQIQMYVHTGSNLEGNCQTKTEMGQIFLGIGSIHCKDSHLCLIVCFTSSSEHTISNRLNAGPLTQTRFPDGGRLFHSTGKQQGGGVVGSFFFFFFADGVGNCSYMPHPDEDGSQGQSQLVCVSLHVTPPLVVSILTGIILD